MPGAPVAPKPRTPQRQKADDDRARTDDDYYHYYLSSQRRVSKWINHTLHELGAVDQVDDEYPDPAIDFGEAMSSSSVGRTREGGAATVRSSRNSRASQGTLREGELRRKSRSRADDGGEALEGDDELTEVDGKSRSSASKSRRKLVYEFEEKADVRAPRPFVRYPDVRTRSVIPDNEPTFTEVMARFGTRKTPFRPGSEIATLLKTEVPSSSRDRERNSSKRSSEPPSDFEISWTYVQPIGLILLCSMFLMLLVPSAAAAIAIGVLGAVAYVTDLMPDLFPRASSSHSSSSSRRKTESSRSKRRTK